MISKALWNVVSLTIPLLIAATAIAQTPTAPAGRFHHSGVYDEARKQFLIYGGFTWDQGIKRVGDVWGWDGAKWQLIGDTGVRKIVAPLAFDSKRQRTMMFGGSGDSTTDGNLSLLNGGAWQLVKDLPSLARMDASLAYDSKRDRLVLFGGLYEQVFLADTWEYDGSDWKPTFLPGPSLRSSAATAYDSARGVTVLYGGFRPLAALGDTWEWNGAQWKLVSETGPGPRSWPGLAYDSKRNRTILFGGEDEKGQFFSDTWAWDGKVWTRLAADGPPAQIQFVMGYDPLRDRIVLFGGVNNNPQRILGDLSGSLTERAGRNGIPDSNDCARSGSIVRCKEVPSDEEFETCRVWRVSCAGSGTRKRQSLSNHHLMEMKALLFSSCSRCIWRIAVVGFAVALPMAAAASPNRRLTPTEVLSVMERVADWQLAHPSVHPATDWTQAAGAAGMLALAGISSDPKYRDALLALGEANGWKPGPRFYHADDLAIGQAYAGLYFLYRDPKMIAPLRSRLDAILSAPPNFESLDFHQPYDQVSQLWSWCDSLFMAPPVWMQLFAATGDERYLDFAVKNWWRTTDYLYDPSEHLYFRDSTYIDRRETNGKKIFWSRGNGWVMAGLVRILQVLPANHPSRTRFERLFEQMAETILGAQQPDGLWHSSLLDPESYPLKESSGSGFYTYALAWGVNQGLLDGAKFKPVIRNAWTALVDSVDREGKLTHVQPIGSDPKTFAEDSTEVYGVGAFLLAGSELYRMVVFENAKPLAIEVTNQAQFYRHCETVEMSLARLAGRGLRSTNLAVMDGLGSRILDSQTYASEPGRPLDTLIFQADLAPGETRTYYIMDASALAAVPLPIVKTYARQIGERYDDMAWESDRIAHRVYHQDLIAAEGTLSSGVDVWVKSTRALVIEKWYKDGDYHKDHGEGLDDYRVGRSRGCGGLGIWDGHSYYVSSNYRSARIITTGPLRSEFELTYDAWDAGEGKISETKRIRIDAGSNMTRVESMFAGSHLPRFEVGIGIAQRPGNGAIAQYQEDGWMSYWQPADRDRGNIGCAVVLPDRIAEFASENATLPKLTQTELVTPSDEGLPPVANLLAFTPAEAGKPFLYYLGAGWSKSGDFTAETDWENYVRQFVAQLHTPLKVKLKNK